MSSVVELEMDGFYNDGVVGSSPFKRKSLKEKLVAI
jgi:hypothetical protein